MTEELTDIYHAAIRLAGFTISKESAERLFKIAVAVNENPDIGMKEVLAIGGPKEQLVDNVKYTRGNR